MLHCIVDAFERRQASKVENLKSSCLSYQSFDVAGTSTSTLSSLLRSLLIVVCRTPSAASANFLQYTRQINQVLDVLSPHPFDRLRRLRLATLLQLLFLSHRRTGWSLVAILDPVQSMPLDPT